MSTTVNIVPKDPQTLRGADGRLVGEGPVAVDPRDPFWRRLIRWGDVSVQADTKTADASGTKTATATTGGKS